MVAFRRGHHGDRRHLAERAGAGSCGWCRRGSHSKADATSGGGRHLGAKPSEGEASHDAAAHQEGMGKVGLRDHRGAQWRGEHHWLVAVAAAHQEGMGKVGLAQVSLMPRALRKRKRP